MIMHILPLMVSEYKHAMQVLAQNDRRNIYYEELVHHEV